METLSIRVRYRPLRIGLCIKRNDYDALRKAVRITNALWGGRYNPIIPVDDSELTKRMVSACRVDLLYPISDAPEIKKFIDDFPYLLYPFMGSELFPRRMQNERESLVLDAYQAIKKLYDDHFKNVPTPQFKPCIYKWDDKDLLADLFLTTFGAYPTKEDAPADYITILEKNLMAESHQILNGAACPEDFFEKLTPYSLSGYALKRHYSSSNHHLSHPGFYVGAANDFEDLVNYWNLRAAGAGLVFYDPAHAGRFNSLRDAYLTKLRSRPKHPSYGNYIEVCSRTPNLSILSEFGEGISPSLMDAGIWYGLNSNYMYFSEKSILASVGKRDNKSSIAFQLPEKPFSDEPLFSRQHIAVAIDTGIGLWGNELETLTTPYVKELNEYYGRNHHFEYDKARVEPENISIVEDIACSSLTLNALNVSELIAEIFKIKKIKAVTSKPGIICKHLIRQMGGLRGCRVFRIAGVRELIETFKATQTFTRSSANLIIQQRKSDGTSTFSKYENLFIEQREINSKLTARQVLEYLLKKKIFRVGLQFKCPDCRLDFWLSLDDVKTNVICEYCGNGFDVSTHIKGEDNWRYRKSGLLESEIPNEDEENIEDENWRLRRSGLLGKDNKQEGAIPVIMLLEHLVSGPSFLRDCLYTTATKLNSHKDAEHSIDCETDFILLNPERTERGIQIAIGECKTRQKISDDDVKKLKSVMDALKDKFDVYVIFVKLSAFSPEEIEQFKIFNEQHHFRLILLTDRELESRHYLYEETEKQFKIKDHASSFGDMAFVTQQIYYSTPSPLPQNGTLS